MCDHIAQVTMGYVYVHDTCSSNCRITVLTGLDKATFHSTAYVTQHQVKQSSASVVSISVGFGLCDCRLVKIQFHILWKIRLTSQFWSS